MIKIMKKLCPESRYSIKCPYTRVPRNIVVHNTGNCAPAENEVSYMINRGDEVSFHAAVDDTKVIEAIPFGRNAWASGDGCGAGNMYGIHIEICYSNYIPANTSLSEKEVYDKFGIAERNAAEYIAALLKQYGWGLDMVTKHQDYDGKKCPHRTLDLGWGRFKNMVKAELDKLNKPQEDTMSIEQFKKMYDEINPTYNTLEEVPSYWRADIKELVDKGIISGVGGGKLGMNKSDCKAAVLAKRIREKL